MVSNLKEPVLSPQVEEAIRKGPSPEAPKLLKAFLMRTSVPRIETQIIRERESGDTMKQGKNPTKREKNFIESKVLKLDE